MCKISKNILLEYTCVHIVCVECIVYGATYFSLDLVWFVNLIHQYIGLTTVLMLSITNLLHHGTQLPTRVVANVIYTTL